ncbi:MAG TPA: sigma 54-interacting transcriptional regulator [bacterium]|nr:sigma 54-interacting transcriptional regulator [bacterium]
MSKAHSGEPKGRDGKSEGQRHVVTSIEDLGDLCLASGEFTTAIEYFSKLLTLTGTSEDLKPRRASLLRRLALCYMRVGKCDHALELLDKAFGLVSEGQDPAELARVISERAWVHLKIGEYDLSEADCESALEIMLAGGKGRDLVDTYNCLAGVCARKGETERAADFLRSALSVARAVNDKEVVGACLCNLGVACKNLGRLSEAQAYMEEALAMAEEVGQHLQKGVRLSNLGIIYSKRGWWRKAQKCWAEALEVLARIGNKWEMSSVLLAMGQYYLTFRDFERAEQYYVLAMKGSSDNGDARGSALSFEFMGDVEMACGRMESAQRHYLQALEIAEEIAPQGDVVVEVKRRLADVETARSNYDAALDLASEAVRLAADLKDVFEHGCSLRSKAIAEFGLGEWEKAREDFARAINLLSSLGEKKELGLTYLKAGQLSASHASSADIAAGYLAEALSIFEEIEMKFEAGLAATALGRMAAGRGDVELCRTYLDKLGMIFGGEIPVGFDEDIGTIQKQADEQVAFLSISDPSDLSAFNAIVARVLGAGDEAAKLDLALEACVERTAAERGVILAKRGDRLEPLAMRGLGSEEISRAVPSLEALLKIAESLGRPLVSTNLSKDGRLVDIPRAVLKGAIMCMPLTLGGATAGCIYLDTAGADRLFTRSDAEFVVAIVGMLKSVLSESQLRRFMEEARFLRSKLEAASPFHGIVGQNKKMLDILESVRFLSKTSTTVLIEGETGTGKEMIARAIHLSGDRRSKPFITIDCSALSTEIVESELFGHVKGAFTDARTDRTGLFEAADGGTVFLDEIDKTSRKFQERLLQVVDKREFKPVGSTVSKRADFRLICATNKDLAKEVENERFLEDLYYRLKVIALKVPPVRERRDDIPLLAEYFLEKHASEMSKSVAGFAPEAMDLLVSFSWPGNVRQIAHEVERAVTFVEDGQAVTQSLFSEDLRGWGSIVAAGGKHGLGEAVEQIERQMIKDALRRFNGNKSKVARNLGLSRRGLLNKMHRYRITL